MAKSMSRESGKPGLKSGKPFGKPGSVKPKGSQGGKKK